MREADLGSSALGFDMALLGDDPLSQVVQLQLILGTCATTAEAKATLAACNVVDYTPKQIPVALPLHVIVHDKDSCTVPSSSAGLRL